MPEVAGCLAINVYMYMYLTKKILTAFIFCHFLGFDKSDILYIDIYRSCVCASYAPDTLNRCMIKTHTEYVSLTCITFI